MPIVITEYQCGLCGYRNNNEQKVIECENSHIKIDKLKITEAEYNVCSDPPSAIYLSDDKFVYKYVRG